MTNLYFEEVEIGSRSTAGPYVFAKDENLRRSFSMLLDLSFVTLDRFSVVRGGPLEIADLLLQALPLTKRRCEVAGRRDGPSWLAL